VIDRLDKHQTTVVAKYHYGPEERKRLLDKINRLVDNRSLSIGSSQGRRSPKNIPTRFPCKPLKLLVSHEGIQAFPTPPDKAFRPQNGPIQEKPNRARAGG
jgi:hypothetical protein